ncbi:MAG: protein tyrosine phosphatase family protein [Kangiellaceae bacterium]|nr:protein tyrosine phosphatase family protein [Kangiellaceae bacterium]
MRCSLLFFLCITTIQLSFAEQISDIPYFKQYSNNFASAGLPKNDQLTLLRPAGFDHVINLVPGDHLVEQETLEFLEVGYSHIPVDWGEPAVTDFEQFVATMQQLAGEKVLLHCELNWRASTFSYLYRVLILNVPEQQAYADLISVWQPKDQWLEFIDAVKAEYQKAKQ